jgi:Flp pilus assembly protein TadG
MATPRQFREQGSVAVEFAIIGTVFVVLLLTIVGFGHWLYTLEAVADATRAGARIAVVCDVNDAAVRRAIQARVPQLSLEAAQIAVEYIPQGCGRANCRTVRVSLSGASYAPWFPTTRGVFTVPPFTTSLPRESLESVNAAGEVNPVCN